MWGIGWHIVGEAEITAGQTVAMTTETPIYIGVIMTAITAEITATFNNWPFNWLCWPGYGDNGWSQTNSWEPASVNQMK